MAEERQTGWIDFDLTLHQQPKQGDGFGAPIQKGIQLLELAKKKGYRMVVLTARTDLDAVRKWLKEYDIKVDGVTNKKPPAAFGIDDRVVTFSEEKSVPQMFQEITNMLTEHKESHPQPKRGKRRKFAAAA